MLHFRARSKSPLLSLPLRRLSTESWFYLLIFCAILPFWKDVKRPAWSCRNHSRRAHILYVRSPHSHISDRSDRADPHRQRSETNFLHKPKSKCAAKVESMARGRP